MLAPRLRHRITLQSKLVTQDPFGTAVTELWLDWLEHEPAEVVPLSGREFIQAGGQQAQIAARVTIRWRAGVTPAMRMSFDGELYSIAAVLPDASARRWLTLMVTHLDPPAEVGEQTVDGGNATEVPGGEIDGGGA